MAPKQKVSMFSGKKTSNSTTMSQKRSTATTNQGEKTERQTKRCRLGTLLDRFPEEDKVVIGSASKGPIELKSPTSFAERKRRRATFSVREIFAESSKKEETPTDHAAAFVPGSTALYTWGAPISRPVTAVGNMRRHKGMMGLGFRRGKESAFVKFVYGSNQDEGEEANTPFRFMDLPLEIRWKIYGHLLIHPKPILLHSDWHTVHVNSPRDHTILRVSKRVLLESTQFLYEKNVFHAVVGVKLGSNPTDGFIKKKFLPYLRNVIVECGLDRYRSWTTYDMVGATATCLGILVKGESLLDSVTLLMNLPIRCTRSGINTMALQSPHPLVRKSIPEYFEAPASKIMRIIPKLRCKVLNIILRLPERKRVLVSINLRGLPVNQDKSGWFAEERTAQHTTRKMANQVKMDLIGLKNRLEDIYEDHEKAIMEGKARLLDDEESLVDGMKL